MSDDVAGDEPYLRVEEVAERLGLPLTVLLHRVEAGDIPSRRIETEDGVHYALRLGDLGIELDDQGLHASAIDGGDESTMSGAFEPPVAEAVEGGLVLDLNDSTGVESAIASAFNSGLQRMPDWSPRPREPQQPPPWIIQGPSAVEAPAAAEGDAAVSATAEAVAEAELPLSIEPAAPAAAAGEGADEDDMPEPIDAVVVADEEQGEEELDEDDIPALIHAADLEPEDELDEETVTAETAVPPPSHSALGIVESATEGPRGDLASMSLDARELVAGLLDRWERTLEQRIYTEQRQRFQAELVARQNMVKQLQMELHTARAEHAAAQAEKDRMLAAKERELADRERDLADTRRKVEEVVDARPLLTPTVRSRRWFRRRDD